jgi:hypothetical protein
MPRFGGAITTYILCFHIWQVWHGTIWYKKELNSRSYGHKANAPTTKLPRHLMNSGGYKQNYPKFDYFIFKAGLLNKNIKNWTFLLYSNPRFTYISAVDTLTDLTIRFKRNMNKYFKGSQSLCNVIYLIKGSLKRFWYTLSVKVKRQRSVMLWHWMYVWLNYFFKKNYKLLTFLSRCHKSWFNN